jgi:hypothetical protein
VHLKNSEDSFIIDVRVFQNFHATVSTLMLSSD